MVVIRYEFAWNEFVNSMETVTLESMSTEEGEKEFIACGTTVFRGEDLAVKGAVRPFTITDIIVMLSCDVCPLDLYLRDRRGRTKSTRR